MLTEPRLYYQDGLTTLWHGDCKDVLAGMDAQSVDCVITDPPYGERTHTMARTSSLSAPAGGRALSGSRASFAHIDFEGLNEVFADLGRVTRRWVISSIDYRHAFEMDATPPEGLRLLRTGVWVKTNPMPQLSGDRPGQGWEAIAFLHRGDAKPRWSGGGRSSTWVLPASQNTGHPTSKPLAMVGDWVRLFTDPGDVIFDPYAGSGTTLRAAVDNGRKAIGVEIEERYCELIANRLAQGALDLEGIA